MLNKRNLGLALVWSLGVMTIAAQNLLPYDWHFQVADPTSVQTRGAKSSTTLNLLLSWERQGYFAGDGQGTLSNQFWVEKPQERYQLKVRLACDIQELKVNGQRLLANLPNQYWMDKEAVTQLEIPRGLLKKGNNHIELVCANLGYTGGVSNALLSLTPLKSKPKEEVHLSLPVDNHVCLTNNRLLTIHYQTPNSATLRLRVETDFHEMLLDSLLTLSPRHSIQMVDLNNVCCRPGFYQLTAVLQGNGYAGDVAWMAVKPEEVVCDNQPIADFADYWQAAKEELAGVAPCFRISKNDSLSQLSQRDVYIAEMQSIGNLTIRGYYFVPRTAGIHKAVLQVPGYGNGYEDISGFMNDSTNRIELALCVRGHGLSADVFHPGFGTPGIWGYKLCDSDSTAYRGLYMDCVRAVEFLRSRPEVDATRIAVKGGSQGGGLALATAALCADYIASCAYFDPFPCDMRHQIKIRTTCETELKNSLAYYGNPCSFRDVMHVQDLLDTRSFAPYIKCPVLYTAALFDDDCPVHEGFTVYNQLTSPKEYRVFPTDGHIEGFSHERQIMQWLDETLDRFARQGGAD